MMNKKNVFIIILIIALLGGAGFWIAEKELHKKPENHDVKNMSGIEPIY